MDNIISGEGWKIILVYLKDSNVLSSSVEAHIEHVEKVLQLLRESGVTIKLRKCSFFQEKVEYLRHTSML